MVPSLESTNNEQGVVGIFCRFNEKRHEGIRICGFVRKQNFAAIFRLLPPLCHNTKKVVSDEFSDPGVPKRETASDEVHDSGPSDYGAQ